MRAPSDSSALETRDLLPLFLLRYDSANTRRSYAHELRSFFGSDRVTLHDALAVSFVAVNEYAARLQAEGKAPRMKRGRKPPSSLVAG